MDNGCNVNKLRNYEQRFNQFGHCKAKPVKSGYSMKINNRLNDFKLAAKYHFDHELNFMIKIRQSEYRLRKRKKE